MYYLTNVFPRYKRFNPIVPVWCITPNEGRVVHRFFNTCPISPSGRYIALFRMPYEDRKPTPGDCGDVIVIDLSDGSEKIVAHSSGWDTQLGANVQWGSTDGELFYNDVDTLNWTSYGVKININTGLKKRLEGEVFSVSNDGTKIISPDLRAMRRIQDGYGVVVPDAFVPLFKNDSKETGIFITNGITGEKRLLIPLSSAVNTLRLGIKEWKYELYSFYIGQCQWNPDGSRFWFQICGIPPKSSQMFDSRKTGEVIGAILCASSDGENICLTVPPDTWVGLRGNHPHWMPSGVEITMNCNTAPFNYFDLISLKLVAGVNKIARLLGRPAIIASILKIITRVTNKSRLVAFRCDSSNSMRLLSKRIKGSGHPSVCNNASNIITDAYTNEGTSFWDGTVPIRLINLVNDNEKYIVRIQAETKQQGKITSLRCDLHPVWDRTYKYIVFNGYDGNTRRVYLAHVEELVE